MTAFTSLIDDLAERRSRVALGGPESSRQRHVERGKLLPRERVDALLDDGTAFLEIAPLAAEGMYGGDAPAAGVIAGIGQVSGRSSPTMQRSRAAPTTR